VLWEITITARGSSVPSSAAIGLPAPAVAEEMMLAPAMVAAIKPSVIIGIACRCEVGMSWWRCEDRTTGIMAAWAPAADRNGKIGRLHNPHARR